MKSTDPMLTRTRCCVTLPHTHVGKVCSGCRRYKPRGEFCAATTRHDGMQATCRACGLIARRTTQKPSDLKRRFGITIDDYNALSDAQQGLCAICRRPNVNEMQLAIDHDHRCCPGSGSCGKCIRGLLCTPCNTGIGMMGDDPERLRAAADYLLSPEALKLGFVDEVR